MDWQTYLTPWTLGGGVCGFLLAVAGIVALAMSRRQISAALATTIRHLFTPVGFFGLVIMVFMIISVLESGEFVNTDITHGAIFGLLGYALALGFDLVSVVCMQARLNATRMRDERGARLNLVGVGICAAVSAFANAAGSLQGYHPADLNRTPGWMQVSAPWLGLVFPALIIVLSMTTDHILDHTPVRDVDVQAFRTREHKRVELLQVRLEVERELLTLDTELSTLRNARERAHGQIRREWIIWRWLRPVVPPPARTIDDARLNAIEQAVQTTHSVLEERSASLHGGLHDLHTWSNEVDHHLRTLHTQIDALPGQSTRLARAQSQRGRSEVNTPAPVHAHSTADGLHAPDQQSAGELDAETHTRTPENASERILVTFQRLGTHATDTEVARASGYSRTTVARWRKRLVAQEASTESVQPAEPAATPANHRPEVDDDGSPRPG